MTVFLIVVLLSHTPEPMNGTYHLVEGEVGGIEISGLELTITDTVVEGEGPCNLFSYTKGKKLFRALAACVPEEGVTLVDEELFLKGFNLRPRFRRIAGLLSSRPIRPGWCISTAATLKRSIDQAQFGDAVPRRRGPWPH